MGVPCMPVRTKCVVIGTELHDALGTLVPPGTPFTPSAITLWTSASTTYYGIGDEPVASVMICGEPAVNKGADTTYARPHMAMLGVAPPNVVVGPIVDWGLFVLVIAVGGTKPVWGPRSVQAGAKSIAVFAIPYSPYCPFNQLICCDPCDIPLGVGLQMPSSVLVGMTLSDYALCILNIVADMLLSFLLNMLFGGMEFLGEFIGKNLAGRLNKILGPKLLKYLAKGLETIPDLLFKKLVKMYGPVIGERIAKALVSFLVKPIVKPLMEAAKKIVEGWMGKLSPGGRLGFGDGPPDPVAGAAP